ncbi:hypothetical protein HK102_000462 [Quaeritorhiza haematococci]|nr:hypothetical protein HK102_000462 [Quaeritorhiza haematococci]
MLSRNKILLGVFLALALFLAQSHGISFQRRIDDTPNHAHVETIEQVISITEQTGRLVARSASIARLPESSITSFIMTMFPLLIEYSEHAGSAAIAQLDVLGTPMDSRGKNNMVMQRVTMLKKMYPGLQDRATDGILVMLCDGMKSIWKVVTEVDPEGKFQLHEATKQAMRIKLLESITAVWRAKSDERSAVSNETPEERAGRRAAYLKANPTVGYFSPRV